ncbi:MAG: toll/interleukin-1 receptor domain-containing protein [Pseudonocardiaceae bacterium]
MDGHAWRGWCGVAQVFISYATPDRTIVGEVSSWLRAAGYEPFFDHDFRDGIGVGEDWRQCLYHELREDGVGA